VNAAPRITIGRAKRNDIVVGDVAVSSLHATIELDDEDPRVFITDQRSSNGTFVNRRRVDANERVVLSGGDCVRFGQRVYYYLTPDLVTLILAHI